MSEYAKRDHMQLDREGGHYSRHVSAMTAEGLHAKSDIAGELAFRDSRIAALLDRLDKAERENERLRSAINWACGYDEGKPHFGEQPEQDAPYAWRHELRRRAGMPWK